MTRIKKESDGSIRVLAPAKVNLFLHVVGRRPDGFHELESLFAFTKTGDEIRLSESNQLELTIGGSHAGALNNAEAEPYDNLVCRAAVLLAKKADRAAAVHIELTKNLPVASGIGGGSADAAATLVGLIALWGLTINQDELMKIALELGADVPACIHSTPLYVTGIGENTVECRLPKSYGILLVNPLVGISTPDVFRAFSEQGEGRFDVGGGDGPSWPLENEAFIEFLKTKTRNALQAPAEAISPKVSRVVSALRGTRSCLHVAMSGSGATCFALFDTEELAVAAAAELSIGFPNWWVKADLLG